jgi:peptidoglycan hydrolase CwlO-like protein
MGNLMDIASDTENQQNTLDQARAVLREAVEHFETSLEPNSIALAQLISQQDHILSLFYVAEDRLLSLGKQMTATTDALYEKARKEREPKGDTRKERKAEGDTDTAAPQEWKWLPVLKLSDLKAPANS